MKSVFPLFAIVLLFSCKSARVPAELPMPVEIELVFSDGFYPVDRPQRFAIDGQEALDGFFGRLGRTRKPAPEAPEVDFKKEMLWVIARGRHPDRHAPVLSLYRRDSLIEVREQYPLASGKAGARSAVYQPLWIYRLPRMELPLEQVE